MTANEPYVDSGRSRGALLLPFVGLASAAVAAFIYQAVVMSLPVVGFITAPLIVGFAFLAAFPLGDVGKVLKVRSVSTMRIQGAMTGIAAVYMAWVFFAWHFSHEHLPPPSPSPWQWLQSPGALWDFANALAIDGWFTIGGSWRSMLSGGGAEGLRPCGSLLWTMWAVEAGIVIGACVYWASRRLDGQPFCEACSRWLQPEYSLALSPKGVLAKEVRSAGLACIHTVLLPRPGQTYWISIRSWRCARCGEAAAFRVDRAVGTPMHDLEVAADHVEPILPLSRVRPEDASHLQRIAEAVRVASFE